MFMKCDHCERSVQSAYCHDCGKAARKSSGSRRKIWGILLIVVPWVGLALTLSLYAIASFVIASLNEYGIAEPIVATARAAALSAEDFYPEAQVVGDRVALQATSSVDVIGSLIRIALGFIGVLCVLGVLIGTPLGIYLIATGDKESRGDAPVPARWSTIKPLGQWVVGLLGFSTALSVVTLVSGLVTQQWLQVSQHTNDSFFVDSRLEFMLARHDVITSIATLIYIVTSVFFLIWLHHAYTNVHARGLKGLRTTPGWAVGWYFVPFANLVMPLLVMFDLWRGSHGSVEHWKQARVPSPIAVWWAAWIIGGLFNWGYVFTEGIDATVTNLTPPLIAEACYLVAGIMLLWIVYAITMAEERHAPQKS